jgi:hypothetical protein
MKNTGIKNTEIIYIVAVVLLIRPFFNMAEEPCLPMPAIPFEGE